MSTPSATLPSDVPTFEDVNCLLKLVMDNKLLFSMRLVYLNSAADAALLWRPYADLIREDKARVNLVSELRSAYYKLEAEAKYSVYLPVRDFKFPKQYHLIADFTKVLIPLTKASDKSNPPATAAPNTASTASQALSTPPTLASAVTVRIIFVSCFMSIIP
ncbi:hypothetical protein CVT24_007875, partial [Panaeolus cyanescens]